MDTEEPKRRAGWKHVATLKGKEPARIAQLPDGRLLVVQADAQPLMIEPDGTVYELPCTEDGKPIVTSIAGDCSVEIDVASEPATPASD